MLRPLRDRIVVRPIVREASSRIEVIHSELPTEGEVVAVGPGKMVKGKLRPLDTKVGDRIRFGEGEYLKFPEYFHGNEKFLVMQEADVAGIVIAA